MEDQELYFQKILNNEFNITTSDTNGNVETDNIDMNDADSNDQLLSIHDTLLDQLEDTNKSSISITSGENQLAEINLDPVIKLKNDLKKLKSKFDDVDIIQNQFNEADSLLKEYAELQKKYDEKVDALEYNINHNFGKVNNTIHKQQGTATDIKPEVFEKVEKKEGPTIKSFLKNSYKKLFQSEKKQSPAATQNKNNTVAAKLNLRKNLIKQLRGSQGSTNPDQLAEELILSLLKPVKGLSASMTDYNQQKNIANSQRANSISQTQINSKKDIKPLENLNKKEQTTLPQFKIEANGKTYSVLGYSEDYATLKLKGEDGKGYHTKNSEGLKLKPLNPLKINPIQKELLEKGKSLLITSGTDLPFKLSKNSQKGDDIYDITTVSISQFKNSNQVKASTGKSVKLKL